MLQLLLRTVGLPLFHLSSCLASVYNDAADLPSTTYDFVIVGGGTAGSVLANRLTEDPENSVLVLEGGVTNVGASPAAIVPFLCFTPDPNYDWGFSTTAQTGLDERVVPFPRGKILGGTSSINWMFWTRGSADDFDRFARVTGDPGWSWENLQPYIHKTERWIPPADHHNTTGEFDPSLHGFHGINSVSLAGFPRSIDGKVIQTSRDLNADFPFNLDYNSGKPLGLGWLQTTIKGGRRSSAATSYLGPQFIERQNLHVLLQALVTRVLPTSGREGQLYLKDVEFSHSVDGPAIRVKATKEVILSAGSIGTPHVLLNSGIGDAQELAAVGVKPLLHLPSVGKELVDHPGLVGNWLVNGTETYDDINRNATLLGELLNQWNETQQGPLVDTPPSHIVFSRLPNNASVFKQVSDPSAGPNAPHFELFVTNGFATFEGPPPPAGNFISISVLVNSPTSRGSVTLNTSNPFDPPLIDPGYMTAPFDIFAMREGLRAAQRFLAAPAWKGYVLQPFGALANLSTDAEIDEFIRANAGSSAHPVGTASMSAFDAADGVVNPDLLLKRAHGLRIVDASVFPFIPGAHPQASVYFFAERSADLIKAAWL